MQAAFRRQRHALMREAIVAPHAARVRLGARVSSVIALFRAQRTAGQLSVSSFHALACLGWPPLSDSTLRRWIKAELIKADVAAVATTDKPAPRLPTNPIAADGQDC